MREMTSKEEAIVDSGKRGSRSHYEIREPRSFDQSAILRLNDSARTAAPSSL